MAWGRFGQATDYDDLPIEEWMDGRNDDVAQRQAYEDAGYGAWPDSTGTGENLQAARPSDVVALGSSTLGADPSARSNQDGAPGGEAAGDPGPDRAGPQFRYVTAKPGDSISSLLGTNSPGAIGRFAMLNGMGDRSSTLYAGRVYALPADGKDPSADDVVAGSQLLARDNARAAASRAQNAANDPFAARLLAGQNVWTGGPVDNGPMPVRTGPSPVAPPAAKPSWYDNPAITAPIGAAAFTGGLLFGGLVRGPVRIGQFIGNTLDFGARLLDSRDAENHPLDEPARERVEDFGRGAVPWAGGPQEIP